MCVILICPPKLRPDLDTLEACARANAHGAGIAWRTRDGQHVRWQKTDSVAEIDRLARQHKGELVIHFRVASVGAVCPELRHPFPIAKRSWLGDTGKAKAVLFQNGTWRGWKHALDQGVNLGHSIPEGPMNDARAAAWLCSIFGHRFLKRCEPSRWVYFNRDKLVHYGQWYERGSILFSNVWWERYLPKKPKVPDLATRVPGELWDTETARQYWNVVERGCPKPVRGR